MTPTVGTLVAPTISISRENQTITGTFSGPSTPNSGISYDVQTDIGDGNGWQDSSDEESPVTITTAAVVSRTYKIRARAKAYGWTNSSWAEATLTTPASFAPSAPTGLLLRKATATEYQNRTSRTVLTPSGGRSRHWYYVSWDSVSGATTYEAYATTQFGSSSVATGITLTEALVYVRAVSNYVVSVRVRARNSHGVSSYTAISFTGSGYIP